MHMDNGGMKKRRPYFSPPIDLLIKIERLAREKRFTVNKMACTLLEDGYRTYNGWKKPPSAIELEINSIESHASAEISALQSQIQSVQAKAEAEKAEKLRQLEKAKERYSEGGRL